MNTIIPKNHDYLLTFLVALLSIIGLLNVYSTTYLADIGSEGLGAFEKQVAFVIVGFIIYLIVSRFDYRWLRYNLIFGTLYIINIILLIITLLSPSVNGVHRWIPIGPIQLQTVEISKIVVLILTCRLLGIWNEKQAKVTENIFETEKNRKNLSMTLKRIKTRNIFLRLKTYLSYQVIRYKVKHPIFISVVNYLMLLIPVILLILIQPSLGNTLLILLTLAILWVLYVPDKSKYLSALTILISAFSAITILVLKLNLITDPKLSEKLQSIQVEYIYILFIGSLFVSAIAILRKKITRLLSILAISFGIILIPLSFFLYNNVITCYQKIRIATFFVENNLFESLDICDQHISIDSRKLADQKYQTNLARSKIAEAGFWGVGYLFGDKLDNRVPYLYTDFAVTNIIQEFGLSGFILLNILFGLLLIRIYLIANNTKELVGKFMTSGIIIYLFLHFFGSIAINLGLIINTGIPTPFVSYGGSFALFVYVSLGLVQAVHQTYDRKSLTEQYYFV